MTKKLIKIFDPEKAKLLVAQGFKYMTESINGTTVYAFFITEELLDYISVNFDKKDFFYDDMLHF